MTVDVGGPIVLKFKTTRETVLSASEQILAILAKLSADEKRKVAAIINALVSP